MTGTGRLSINVSKPIEAAAILNNYGPGFESSNINGINSETNDEHAKLTQDLENHKNYYAQVCQALNTVTTKFNELYDKAVTEHREEIARLSVEIARKILVQKVQDGDYQIETIVKEALKKSPTRQDIIIHLNPNDFEQCSRLQETDKSGILADIKFVPDGNIGLAECLIETPKGAINSLIEEHLEQIRRSLEKAG